ncbi:MAG TPA: hypothetical protein VJZ51_00520 [Bacilli bacterium]|nr:hypothetical protein [Bacilli bacterium]
MEIQWFSKSLQGIATIYETNITLNTVASSYFKNAFATLVGFNKQENILLIKALNKEEVSLGNYSPTDLHDISIKPSYGRLNGKGIIKKISEFFPMDFEKKKLYKFCCSWDESNKYLKIYLEEEIK